MTLNGAIRQLAQMRDNEFMPTMFKPFFDKVIETVSECEEPTADVAPVRHGRWEPQDGWDGDEYYRCSICGAEFVLIDGTPSENGYFFCPHCGADMREKNE